MKTNCRSVPDAFETAEKVCFLGLVGLCCGGGFLVGFGFVCFAWICFFNRLSQSIGKGYEERLVT